MQRRNGFQLMHVTGDGTRINPIGNNVTNGEVRAIWLMKIVKSSDAEIKIVPETFTASFVMA
jgi:hypothetical protein